MVNPGGYYPFFLPDGQHFLFRQGTGPEAGIYVAALGSSNAKLLMLADSAGVYAAPGSLLFSRGGGTDGTTVRHGELGDNWQSRKHCRSSSRCLWNEPADRVSRRPKLPLRIFDAGQHCRDRHPADAARGLWRRLCRGLPQDLGPRGAERRTMADRHPRPACASRDSSRVPGHAGAGRRRPGDRPPARSTRCSAPTARASRR